MYSLWCYSSWDKSAAASSASFQYLTLCMKSSSAARILLLPIVLLPPTALLNSKGMPDWIVMEIATVEKYMTDDGLTQACIHISQGTHTRDDKLEGQIIHRRRSAALYNSTPHHFSFHYGVWVFKLIHFHEMHSCVPHRRSKIENIQGTIGINVCICCREFLS